MSMELFDLITFKEFYNLLNKRYGKTQMEIAYDWNISDRTLRRWINISNFSRYYSLSSGRYFQMFKSLEDECSKHGDNIIEVLVNHFCLPSEYLEMDYNNLKQIIILNLDKKLTSKSSNQTSKISSQKDTKTQFESKQFLQTCLEHKDDIESICMAFHSVCEFYDDRNVRLLLIDLYNSGVSIQVIANSDSAIKQIATTIKNHNLSKYIGFNQNFSKWADRISKLNNLHFRVSEYPILRKIYIAKYKDKTTKALFRDYVYGYSQDDDSSLFTQLSDKEPSLAIFMREFDFLWNNAKEYPDWFNTLPKQEELMSSGNYVLLYLSHKENSEDINDTLSDFTVSTLSIEEDNKVKLYSNIPNTIDFEIDDSLEYTYQGKLKLTRNNIFMSLYDKTEQKQINISLRRSLYDTNRFLGIMTDLSPNGQPVAFKCACVSKSIFSKLDISQVKYLLGNNHRGKDSLIILNEQDINDFYSNQILIKDN